MNYIFVDFEMNPIDRKNKEARKTCTQEIIEIGAVMLNEKYEETDSFKMYVKPEFNTEITRKCTDITGITTEMVERAASFNEALQEFVNWCVDKGKDYEIYAWSENDLIQLVQEMRLKKTEGIHEINYMTSHWSDFQREYCDLLGLYKPISLETAIGSIGRDFDGQMHDALCDARNTAYIYSLSRDKEKFQEVMQPILDLLNPAEEDRCMLGELFNFNHLVFEG